MFMLFCGSFQLRPEQRDLNLTCHLSLLFLLELLFARAVRGVPESEERSTVRIGPGVLERDSRPCAGTERRGV